MGREKKSKQNYNINYYEEYQVWKKLKQYQEVQSQYAHRMHY